MNTTEDRSNGILLSTVTDVFVIEGRGCVILPGAPYPSATIPVLRRGAPIMLRRPDGSELASRIRDLEMINRGPTIPFMPILLQSPISNDDIPIGTEVWYFPTAEDTYASGRIAESFRTP
ncbi:MAG: hypothetical protein ABJF10_20600 [Chthoniobacter sp.]|uniref:hypothetical protein n=1 Tax=Chthoniobacter sp. TaxID=2510640 RepID=UPI0032A41434